MENKDKDQSTNNSIFAELHHTHKVNDDDDCIILNADVHDIEIDIDIEDAVINQSVVVDAVSFLEKQDIEEAIVSEKSAHQDVVEVFDDDRVVEIEEVVHETKTDAIDAGIMIELDDDDTFYEQKTTKNEWHVDLTDDVGVIDVDDNKNHDTNGRVDYLHIHQSEPTVTATASKVAYPTQTDIDDTSLDVSTDSIHKKHAFFPKNFTKPLLFLAGSSVLGIWVMQQSINAYFLQTYHKPSPLANIDNGVWKAGAKVHDGLAQIKQGIQNAEMDTSVPSVDTPTKSIVVAQEVPPPTMTIEQINKDFVKTSLTLNKTQKVFFAGDSLMQGVAPHIQKHLQEFGVKSVNLSKQSTGLAYPKFFDWPTTIKNTITKDKDIKVLVIMLGPNDPWDMPVKGSSQYLKFQSPEWDSEYQSRMADILNFAKENNVGVIWVTPPNMRKEKLDTQMMHINEVMMAELKRHQVQVIDARPVMGSIDNKYSDYLIKDDKKIKMRTGDGIHFTPDGQRELARHIQSFLTIEP